jgi:hypothetical protein
VDSEPVPLAAAAGEPDGSGQDSEQPPVSEAHLSANNQSQLVLPGSSQDDWAAAAEALQRLASSVVPLPVAHSAPAASAPRDSQEDGVTRRVDHRSVGGGVGRTQTGFGSEVPAWLLRPSQREGENVLDVLESVPLPVLSSRHHTQQFLSVVSGSHPPTVAQGKDANEGVCF